MIITPVKIRENECNTACKIIQESSNREKISKSLLSPLGFLTNDKTSQPRFRSLSSELKLDDVLKKDIISMKSTDLNFDKKS